MSLSLLVRLLSCAAFSIMCALLCLCLLFTGKSVEAMIMLFAAITMVGFQVVLDEMRFPLYAHLQEEKKNV